MDPRDHRLVAWGSLLGYSAYQWQGYRVARHHRLIAQKLEAVEAGHIKRLMIFIPPRHGKSMLASENFPAWFLGRNPDRQIIACTYGQDLANDFGRKVRNQLRDPMYRRIFPDSGLRDDSKAAGRFHTRTGGVYMAVGVGGPITGRGAHVLLIDDPLKNREEADSEAHRRKLKDWYGSTAYTRLMPGGAVVLIQTRWHEDDLAGWLLTEHAHEGWEVVSLPALNETGGALWPEAYPVDVLSRIRAAIGPRDWEALYQQRPRPVDGLMFQRGWLLAVDAVPVGARWCRYWDKAGTDGGGAYTAGALVAHKDGITYLADMVRGQWSAGMREATIKQTAQLDGQNVAVWVEQEPGSGGKESAEATIRNLQGFNARAERVTGDKVTRAQPLAAQAEAGNVRIVRGDWNRVFLDEIEAFPLGKFKDQVDAASGGYNKLAPVKPILTDLPGMDFGSMASNWDM